MIGRATSRTVDLDALGVPAALQPFARESLARPNGLEFDLKRVAAAEPLLATTGPERAALAVDAAVLSTEFVKRVRLGRDKDPEVMLWAAMRALAFALFRGKLTLDEPALLRALAAAIGEGVTMANVPASAIVGCAERHVAAHGLSDAVRAALERVRDADALRYAGSAERRHLARVALLIQSGGGGGGRDDGDDDDGNNDAPLPTRGSDPWVERMAADHRAMSPAQRRRWAALLRHAKSATGAAPARRWLAEARPLADAVGLDAFEHHWRLWTGAAAKGAVRAVSEFGATDPVEHALDRDDADVLRGLIWGVVALPDDRHDRFAPALADLAERAFVKLKLFGPRCPKAGNASVVALSLLAGGCGLPHLVRLGTRVKQPSGRKMIARTLGRAADRLGLTADELEERSIPTFDLAGGAVEQRVGDCTFRLDVSAGRAVPSWADAAGARRKAPPAAVARAHPATVREIKRRVADIAKALAAERPRFERLFLRGRAWPVADWLRDYHDHPLAQVTARRLVWAWAGGGGRGTRSAAWDGRRFVDAADRPAEPAAGATVRLWHPTDAAADDVLAWRQWLDRHRVTQPFKQAHREVYLLTDAERATHTYSNRFAGHLVRQHQFAALCGQRGWAYSLMGSFDSHPTPTIELPAFGLRAEFWVDAAHAAADTSPTGIFLYVATDQVRFARTGSTEPLPLDEVPPLVLSEVMRDVDLFVGVASVGNDPAWQDGGPEGRYRTYWQSYSFGELSETARTRRAVLESLLPRLTRLRNKWSLTERFLVVRGSVRTYKIHLGSGNILMEPNDQYLCIVPGRGAAAAAGGAGAGGVFLPFEGDGTLSVILSKALLLADDARITDASITSQINRR